MYLRHYAWVLWRWLWLILLGTAVCAGAAYAISKRLSPTYDATALVLVNGSTVSSADYNNILSSQALATSYSLLAKNPAALAAVAHAVPGTTVDQLQTSVTVSPDADTQVIQVVASAPSAKQAADTANAVATTFTQREEAALTAQLNGIAAPIITQVNAAHATMDAADNRLSALQHTLYYYYSPNTQQQITNEIAQQQAVFDEARSNYEAQLASYNTIHMAQLEIPNRLTLAQLAVPPTKAKGSVLLNTALAGALGLLLMVTLVLILDHVDKSIRTPEDVANLAGLEPLGGIPNRRHPEALAAPLDASQPPDEALQQAFIAIGANLCALRQTQRFILLSSTRPRAGVSTVAANLAVALAHMGVRVLLIDANFQNPSLHRFFPTAATESGARVLSSGQVHQSLADLPDDLDWHETEDELPLDPEKTRLSGLALLPLATQDGDAPTPRAYLSEMRSLKEALTGASSKPDDLGDLAADIVLVDTPALNQSADTVLLASVADAVLFVTRARKESPESLAKAHATFERLGCPVIGVVVNRQRAHDRPYFYVDRPRDDALAADGTRPGSAVEANWLVVQPASRAQAGVPVMKQANGTSMNGVLDQAPHMAQRD